MNFCVLVGVLFFVILRFEMMKSWFIFLEIDVNSFFVFVVGYSVNFVFKDLLIIFLLWVCFSVFNILLWSFMNVFYFFINWFVFLIFWISGILISCMFFFVIFGMWIYILFVVWERIGDINFVNDNNVL